MNEKTASSSYNDSYIIQVLSMYNYLSFVDNIPRFLQQYFYKHIYQQNVNIKGCGKFWNIRRGTVLGTGRGLISWKQKNCSLKATRNLHGFTIKDLKST